MTNNLQNTSKKLPPNKFANRSSNKQDAWVSDDMRVLLNSTEMAAILLDDSLQVKYFNKLAASIFELTNQNSEVLFSKIKHSLDYDALHDDVSKAVATDECFERQVANSDGHWFSVRILPYRSQEDKIERVTITLFDTTYNKELEKNLERTQEELIKTLGDFEKMFLVSTYMVCIITPDGVFKKVSPAFSETLGFAKEEFLEKVFTSFLHPDDQASSFQTLQPLSKGMPITKFSNRYMCKDGSYRWLEWSARSFVNGGNIYAIAYDVTEHKRTEEKLKDYAHYDLLTHLPNRVLLAEKLNQAMKACKRKSSSLAVAFLDLDEFKKVNDTHGHAIGDELLVIVSQRMRSALRTKDTLARIGGDEFIAVLVDVKTIDDSKAMIKRLLEAAAKPVSINGLILNVSASIGITFYPQDDIEADQLIRQADHSMYAAKQAGKNRYSVFDADQEMALKVQHETIDDIQEALINEELVLYYQPKVNIQTGEVIGAEALIRWDHPTRGLIFPLDFLPAIEGLDVSVALGEWVINTALTQMKSWQQQGINLSISVNISAYQLLQPNFAERLALLLSQHPEIKPEFLELEVLETSSLEDISRASSVMNECKKLGVNFSLDDFGTGYSSLTYLKRLPAHMIKIDQSFVRDMLKGSDDLAIVKGVVGLAKAFQLKVIAEGVETPAHKDALLALGCELAQGYGIARPMPAQSVEGWFSQWQTDQVDRGFAIN
ncbi:EAL domain-containing protein [Leucothrix sargassi]|nr:EAL domain-containing protein [Leucothrix sargassi]